MCVCIYVCTVYSHAVDSILKECSEVDDSEIERFVFVVSDANFQRLRVPFHMYCMWVVNKVNLFDCYPTSIDMEYQLKRFDL